MAAMKQKLQTTDAELLSAKEELQNAKILEEQMRSAVVVANTEVESLVKEKDEALKAEQNMKAEIASAKLRAEEAQRRFVVLEEQAKEARNKLSVDIESLKKQYEAKLSHLKRELRRLEEEKEENRCSALASNDKVRNLQNRLNVLEERAKNDAAQISSLKDAVEASKTSKEQMRKAVESANAEFKEALKRWEGLESQVGNLAASERSLLAQVERLRLQLREKQM
jgi:chromosome segregation ATPase